MSFRQLSSCRRFPSLQVRRSRLYCAPSGDTESLGRTVGRLAAPVFLSSSARKKDPSFIIHPLFKDLVVVCGARWVSHLDRFHSIAAGSTIQPALPSTGCGFGEAVQDLRHGRRSRVSHGRMPFMALL